MGAPGPADPAGSTRPVEGAGPVEPAGTAGPRDDADAPHVPEPEPRGTSLREVVQSVAAGFIGVQSSRNRERDFTRGNPLHFVIGGVVGTLLFLLAVYVFVRVVIATN